MHIPDTLQRTIQFYIHLNPSYRNHSDGTTSDIWNLSDEGKRVENLLLGIWFQILYHIRGEQDVFYKVRMCTLEYNYEEAKHGEYSADLGNRR